MSVGPWQLILILGLILLFFGPSRLPSLGRSVGEAIRGFKKGIESADTTDEIDVTAKSKLDSESTRKENSKV